MLSIYNYTEVHKFLRDSWKQKKQLNPAFSMSAWSKQLGLESSSPLSLAFKGKRTLPKKYIPNVVRSLDLNNKEGIYLETLIDFSKAKAADQKLYYLKRLAELSPSKDINNTAVEEYKYISDPIHIAILEMSDLKGFRNDARWIKNKLRMPITITEVQEVLDRLLSLKLLVQRDGPRGVKKSHDCLSSENDVADLGSKKFHKAISEIAAQQIFEQSIEEREFASYTFNIKRGSMPKAKKMIRSFLNDFFEEFEADPETAFDIYQINLQLFKMTK